MLRQVKEFLLVFTVTAFYWCYSRLWRIQHVNYPDYLKGKPKVFAHWHGDELLLIGAHVFTGLAIMASRSRDGELLRRMLTSLGYRVVRGSSTRGGAGGLKGLIDLVEKEQCDASLAVDGPRGPLYKVKPGIIKLAQQTQCPLVLGASSARYRFIFRTAWNRCYLPLPFSKCVVLYSEPMQVPKQLSNEEFERWRLRLELALLDLKARAEAYFHRVNLVERLPQLQ